MKPDEAELVRRMDAAMTREEINAVMPQVQQWMHAHPNDRFDSSRPVWGAAHKMQRRQDALS